MLKFATLAQAKTIMDSIYQENPRYWPYGLEASCFDGGLYTVREKRSNKAVGFAGWQERDEYDRDPVTGTITPVKVGYYSIGVLPEYRNKGFGKAAVSNLLRAKAGRVDRVRALIVSGNAPSMALAESLQVPVIEKRASCGLSARQLLALV